MKRALILTLTVFPPGALAHHPLAGAAMESFHHGVLSGLAHPLLGFDHLFFVILVGIIAACGRAASLTVAAYVFAVLSACTAVALGWSLPGVEFAVALSLLGVGVLALTGRRLRLGQVMSVFAVAGLFHGAAFAGAMAGTETSNFAPVMTGYLLGLGIIQYLLCLGAGWVLTHLWRAANPSALAPRLAGAMVTGAGLFLVLEHLERYAFAAAGVS